MLGLLLQSPDTWPDVNFLSRDEFSDSFKHLFDVVKQQLDSNQSVTPIIVAEKLKSFGMSGAEIGGVETLIYLEGLHRRGRSIEKKDALALAKELKKASVKRDLIAACKKAALEVEKAQSFDEMTSAVTKTLTSIETDYFKGGNDTEEMFGTLIARIEELGNNPLDPALVGYSGVLPSIDRALGPLIGPGNFVNVTARQNSGKSSFAFFYAIQTALKHNLPILWTDVGEMSLEQLQKRAVCCLSDGRVPLWAIKSGQWRTNPQWEKIIRQEVWPKVRKLKLYYRSTAGLAPKEKVNFIRRFYFNTIGRGNFLIIIDDYLKGVESLMKDSAEWQGVGYYVSDVKSLVTDEINASFWTSTQANRMGISKGKKMGDIVENDSVVGLSDRINHNATHAFFLRYKVTDELAREKNSFGNTVAKVLKIRDGLGMEFEQFMRPIKVGGGYVENHFNLDYHGFHYVDKGWNSEMLARLGHTAVDLKSQGNDEQMP